MKPQGNGSAPDDQIKPPSTPKQTPRGFQMMPMTPNWKKVNCLLDPKKVQYHVSGHTRGRGMPTDQLQDGFTGIYRVKQKVPHQT